MVSPDKSGLLVDRVGLKLGLFCGLAQVGLGAAIRLGVHSLRFFIFARVFQGIGVAVIYPVLGGLIMAWFSERERHTSTRFLLQVLSWEPGQQ